MTRVRFRRARAVLAYWKDDRLFLDNYATRVTISASPLAIHILSAFDRWQPPGALAARFPEYTPASLAKAVRELARHTMLVREGTAGAEHDTAIANVWASWLPEGGFHFATKNAPYVDQRWGTGKRRKILPDTPQPPFFKSDRKAAHVALPPRTRRPGEFENVLLERRTHRRFAKGAVALADVSTLLSLVWGVQSRITSPIFGSLAHKTSPSGGARHPGEVYLMARNVTGLAHGIYHYDALRHRLETIRTGPTANRAWRYCVRQNHARDAAALFVMTAVFPRTMWKYHAGRAYRVVLLDAGHLCQTFCLTATWLGLGPFSTAALDDDLIERDLKIDGVSESVLYVAGVGRPLDSGVV